MNWLAILDRHRVYYRTSGPNCAQGHAVVKCPFCGSSDEGEHMGINLENGKWGCWRNILHRGRSPVRLLMKLLDISYAEASELTGKTVVDTEDFANRMKMLLGADTAAQPTSREKLRLPEEFRPLWTRMPSAKPYHEFLVRRRFPYADTEFVADMYELRYCYRGEFTRRLIFPVYTDTGLAAWTGRAIDDRTPKYLSNSGAMGIKNTIWNFDLLLKDGGRVLVIAEGPFDALKLDWYGRPLLRATCLFGVSWSQTQLDMIRAAADGFERVVIMLDRDATTQAMRLADELCDLSPRRVDVLPGRKDPGEYTESDVRALVKNL